MVSIIILPGNAIHYTGNRALGEMVMSACGDKVGELVTIKSEQSNDVQYWSSQNTEDFALESGMPDSDIRSKCPLPILPFKLFTEEKKYGVGVNRTAEPM